MTPLIAEIRSLMERATKGPWCVEQCGEKCDAPVIGIAWRLDDPDCTQLSGWVESYDEDGNEVLYREAIAYEIEGCEGRSASANAALIVAAVNALPTLLALAEDGERLKEALEPFAECCDQIAKDESDEEWAKFSLLIGDCRRARAALNRGDR